jgi:hypothetical protein
MLTRRRKDEEVCFSNMDWAEESMQETSEGFAQLIWVIQIFSSSSRRTMADTVHEQKHAQKMAHKPQGQRSDNDTVDVDDSSLSERRQHQKKVVCMTVWQHQRWQWKNQSGRNSFLVDECSLCFSQTLQGENSGHEKVLLLRSLLRPTGRRQAVSCGE